MIVPKSWGEITLKQFIFIHKLDKKIEAIDLSIKLLSIVLDRSEEDIQSMDIKEFTAASNQLTFLSDVNMSDKIIYSFEIDGKQFDLNLNIESVKTSDYIDITSYYKDSIANIHKIMSCLCKSKEGLSKNEMAQLFYDKMPITIAYPAVVFFCKLSSNFTKATLSFLESKRDKALKKAMKILKKESLSLKNGDGLPQ